MKKGSLPSPLLGRLLKKIAPKIGAKVILEPKWHIVGQIAFNNGRKRYFRYSSLDLNPLGASAVSQDKDYSSFFMKHLGYPTVPGQTFFSKPWAKAIGSRQSIDAAYRYALRLGLPVIVKPNSRTQGLGVAKVYTKREFYKALRYIFEHDRVALVQPVLQGKDYRVVVLDGKIISAYQRIPLNIIGDGNSTIRQLLIQKQKNFIASSRDTTLKITDPRIGQKLQRQHYSMRAVPKKGQCIPLLDNANLSTGGDAIDVTAHVHPAFKKLAINLTKDMGLRLCGVDLMIAGDIANKPDKFWILETNPSPGLDHYALTGTRQKKIVELMYTKILKALR